MENIGKIAILRISGFDVQVRIMSVHSYRIRTLVDVEPVAGHGYKLVELRQLSELPPNHGYPEEIVFAHA